MSIASRIALHGLLETRWNSGESLEYNAGMSTSFDQIVLTPEQKLQVVQLAEQSGMPWDEVLDDALAAYRPQVQPLSESETNPTGEPDTDDESSQLRRRFDQLCETWKAQTRFSSSTTEISTHPAYQQIIGMGRAALPFIFSELRQAPDHWYWALKAITGEDPVPAADRGNLPRMTSAWLRWAEIHGFSPA